MVDEQYSGKDENRYADLDWDDVEAMEAAAEASIARTQAIYAEIARLETEAAQAQEIAAQMNAEGRIPALMSNSLRGMQHRQIPPAGLNLDVPAAWLEDAPQPCDKKLANDMKMIANDTWILQ